MDQLTTVETNKGRFWLDGTGVVRVVSLPDTDQSYDLADAKQFVAAIERLSEGNQIPILIEMSRVRSVSKKARQYFAGKQAGKITRAVALITKSKTAKMIANFFIGFAKPPFPTKMFNSEDEAQRWLEHFIAQENVHRRQTNGR